MSHSKGAIRYLRAYRFEQFSWKFARRERKVGKFIFSGEAKEVDESVWIISRSYSRIFNERIWWSVLESGTLMWIVCFCSQSVCGPISKRDSFVFGQGCCLAFWRAALFFRYYSESLLLLILSFLIFRLYVIV